MSGRSLRSALAGACLVALCSAPASAVPAVPSQFVVEDVAPGAGFNTPTGVAFFPGGRMLVAEKRGRVYTVVNGVKSANPLWQQENEILNNGDRGLLGVAVDPRYNGTTNRWIYLLYTVDPDSNGTDTDDDAYGRLIRVQVSATDSNAVDYSTRQVLFGVSWALGPVSCSTSHTIGTIRFARDGSLIVSCGDGAQFNGMDAGGQDPNAFLAGRSPAAEDIGAFRAQYIGSLAGKILRINPDNGQGYPSNPYWDGNASSVRSRVWEYGVRNTYRFCMKPGTGSTIAADGNPGTIYMGEVGWSTWEELNIARTPGLNFGWPCYEGLGTADQYQAATPSHAGCGTLGTSENPATSVTPPTATWHHTTDALSVPSGFHGNTSIGGVFYSSTRYPGQFRNQYFFGDYGQNWIKVAVLDANDNLLQVLPFGTAMDGPVDFNLDPVTGDVIYVSINTSQVRRIRYTGSSSGNAPPVASLTAIPSAGPAPLTVSFSAAGSTDPNNDPLTYAWVFGDGAGGSGVTISHTYANAGTYTAQLTVSDSFGGIDVRTATINVGGSASVFPTTPVLDDFNRANGPIGGLWVDQVGGLNISSNQLVQPCCGPTTVWDGGVFGPDQEAYFTFNAVTPAADEQDIMLKVQGTSYAAGHIEVRYTANQNIVQVSTHTPSGGWVSRGGPIAVTFAPGDQFGARALGNGTIEVYKNGVKIGSTTAGNWPYAANGGRVGLTMYNATASRFDNFGGGNVVFNSNTKPTASIQSPVNGSFYYTGQAVTLAGTGSDAQTPAGSLGYQWVLDLHHNTHIHPGVLILPGQTNSFVGENHDDGTGVYYEVKFVVTDAGGLTDTARVNIYPEVDLAPSAITVTPGTPQAGGTTGYSFKLYNRGRMPAPFSRWVLRAGGTLIAQGDTLVAANDSVLVSVSAPSLAAGSYTLRARADSLSAVTETNETNNASVASLTVSPAPGNRAPIAAASRNPASGIAPLTVAFSSAGSSDPDGDPITFAWAFGDGGTGSGAAPSHTYTTPGSYNAVLTVSDNRGGSATATVAVTVNPNHAPVAAAAGTPTGGTAPLAVAFSSAGSSDPDGDPLTFAWAFGDAGTGSGASPSHTYTSGGTYTAVLTVSDGRGATATASVTITVAGAPVTFPATAILDNFNRANGVIGPNWENSVGFSISANRLKPANGFPNTTWVGATYGANQEAFITFATVATTSPEQILWLKVQNQFWYNGHIEVNYQAPNNLVAISTYDPNSGWKFWGNVPATFANGDQFGARANANGNVTVYKNGAALGTVSAAGWRFSANGGYIGMTFTNAPSALLDDYGGGNAPATSAPLAISARISGPDGAPTLPSVLALSAPHPNPSAGAFMFALDLPSESEVAWSVLDLQGRVVWEESPRRLGAGRQWLNWSGRTHAGPAAPGIYLVRVKAAGETFLKRAAVVR